MNERPPHPASASPGRRSTLGEELRRISDAFDEEGALGVVLVDAAALAPIEKQYGGTALQRAMGTLGDMIQGFVADRLAVSDTVVLGDIGRDEIAVLLLRPAGLFGKMGRAV